MKTKIQNEPTVSRELREFTRIKGMKNNPTQLAKIRGISVKPFLLLLSVFCFLLSALPGRAQSTTLTNILTTQTINGSVTGAVFVVTAAMPYTTMQVYSGGITNAGANPTNALPTIYLVSLDNINFITNSIQYHSTTNPEVMPQILSGAVNLYIKPVVVTTNGLSAGILKQL